MQDTRIHVKLSLSHMYCIYIYVVYTVPYSYLMPSCRDINSFSLHMLFSGTSESAMTCTKDSLTHRPSSQGWASWCLLGLFFYAIFNFLCVMYIYMCAFICVALFVWVGITFLPLYSLASVLYTCISMYRRMYTT